MDEVEFLSLDDLLEIHRDQISHYGGSPGVRDMGMLESAASMPAAGFEGRFLHEDVFEMAAAYLFHIAQNHPFVDGNKRTGAVAALVFLLMNGIESDAEEDELENLVRGVAAGQFDKATAAAFFRSKSGR